MKTLSSHGDFLFSPFPGSGDGHGAAAGGPAEGCQGPAKAWLQPAVTEAAVAIELAFFLVYHKLTFAVCLSSNSKEFSFSSLL